jgi:hypothetical protein
MTKSSRRRPAVLAAATLLTCLAALPASGQPLAGPVPGTPPPPPPEAETVVQEVVPLPASITHVRFPHYTQDGAGLLAAARSSEFAGTQIVSFAENGTDLRCLTCVTWTGDVLGKPVPFPDGRRVLVRIGEQTPTTPARHGVLECAPSVSDCRQAAVVPIVAPAADDPNVLADQREFRVAPDGVHVALSQLRATAAGRTSTVGIVGRLVRGPAGYQVDDARVVTSGAGELKGFTPDGTAVVFTRYLHAFEAGNPDDVTVDLRTGRERRLTTALDWDEDVDISPVRHGGRRWMVVGSARGAGLLESVSQVRRPPFVDMGIQALPFAAFATRQPEIAEPWLVDIDDARGDYLGQPLAPGALAAGWDSRTNFRWKPDGTAVVFGQQQVDGPGTRIVISRLVERTPGHRSPIHSVTPGWAPPLAGFVPADPTLPESYLGSVSGDIRITRKPSPLPEFDVLLEIRYSDFADEPGFVIDGVERSHYTDSGTGSLYQADLRVSGRHTGFLRAADVLIRPNSVRGIVESEVDGRRLTLGPLP